MPCHSTQQAVMDHPYITGKHNNDGIYVSLLRRVLHYFGTHRLGTLEGKAKCTGPQQLWETTESTRHSKQNRVEAHLCHSIILQQQQQTLTISTGVYRYLPMATNAHGQFWGGMKNQFWGESKSLILKVWILCTNLIITYNSQSQKSGFGVSRTMEGP